MAKPLEIVVATRLVNTYASATKRQKDFSLTMSYLSNIAQQKLCAYSGEPFREGVNDDMMTLERFDNDKGYVPGNVIPVKKKYNSARGNFSLEELIEKRDELASRIVRAADAGGHVIVDQQEPESEDPLAGIDKKYHKQYLAILNNIAKREHHMKQKGVSAEVKKSLQARITGGKAELKRLRKVSGNTDKLASKAATTSKKATKAENSVHNYDIVIKGLTRFQNLSFIDKAKLNKGLPLSASMFQLIRGKM